MGVKGNDKRENIIIQKVEVELKSIHEIKNGRKIVTLIETIGKLLTINIKLQKNYSDLKP